MKIVDFLVKLGSSCCCCIGRYPVNSVRRIASASAMMGLGLATSSSVQAQHMPQVDHFGAAVLLLLFP